MAFIDTREIDAREPFAGYRARFVHSAHMTFAHWEIDAGATLPRHAHHHEQVVNVIEGQFELTIGSDTRVLGPGGVAIIPSNVPHEGRAITSCRIIDAFHPIREDYRQ